MRFWDSSAVVPLLIQQPASPRATAWFNGDAALVLWTLTSVEVTSALRRLAREARVKEDVAHHAETRLQQIVHDSHLVIDVEAAKELATRLLRLHVLRAFDALQLAAALLWAEGHPRGRVLHTLDDRLALAARREGFSVPV